MSQRECFVVSLLLVGLSPFLLCRPATGKDSNPAVTPRVGMPAYTAPADMIAERETADVLQRVRITSVHDVWISSPSGMIPFLSVHCEVLESWKSDSRWKRSTKRLLQLSYSDFQSRPISPPSLPGREYLLWATYVGAAESVDVKLDVDWVALPNGVLLISGTLDSAGDPAGEFVQVDGKFFSLKTMHALVQKSTTPIGQLKNPVARIEVCRQRLAEGTALDIAAAVAALRKNVLDPAGEIDRMWGSPPPSGGPSDWKKSTYYVWYHSLGMLLELAKLGEERDSVVKILHELESRGDERAQFVVAVALAELGEPATISAIVRGYESDLGSTEMDPATRTSQGGYLPYENRGMTVGRTTHTAAYTLGRLGDDRGLNHRAPSVQLAAADGLCRRPKARAQAIAALKRIANSTRSIDRSTQTEAHRLLCRLGDRGSLGALVKAWLEGSPDSLISEWRRSVASPPQRPLMVRPLAFLEGDDTRRLGSLRDAFGNQEEAWESERMQILRASLGDSVALARVVLVKESAKRTEPSNDDIAALLKSSDRADRERGMHMAASNDRLEFHDIVLQAALDDSDPDARMVALGVLSRYQTSIPMKQLKRLEGLATDDQQRMLVFEMGTRHEPAAFSALGVELLSVRVRDLRTASQNDNVSFEVEHALEVHLRLMSRLCRDGIPAELLAALKHEDPGVRSTTIYTLGMGGNPEAISAIREFADDPRDFIREPAEEALRKLGDY